MHPPPPQSTLFPYTTLFRSSLAAEADLHGTDASERVTVTGEPEGAVRIELAGSRTGGGVSRRFEPSRSEEHTSELQSQSNLVCRLLLEKKKHASACDRSPEC